ncbi:MAG TPA: FMN-binding negative transcriptional regulator [Steroidobacteraceae bacterium]|nr:FMN-binding negative transcriptional regulator [Steroidobacteraceae bacterium]
MALKSEPETAGVYLPEDFRETRIEVLQDFVDRHPLATLVANGSDGLTANHIPMHARLDAGERGTLRGHIARANRLWRDLAAGAPVLAIFMGADHYVSPTCYPSKREHGKVVPTWNYATVHIHGQIRFIDDAMWLRELVGSLTDAQESARSDRWQVNDAPPDYLAAMLKAIVGFEIEVNRIVGKFKGSQNRSAADRAGVRAALASTGVPPEALAELVPRSSP